MKKCDCASPDCASPIRCPRLRCRVQALLDSKELTPRGAEHRIAMAVGPDQKLPRGFVSDLIDGKKDTIYKYRSELAKILNVDEGFLFEGILPRRTGLSVKRIPGIPLSERPQPKRSRREELNEKQRKNQKPEAVGDGDDFDANDAPGPNEHDLLDKMLGRHRENRFAYAAHEIRSRDPKARKLLIFDADQQEDEWIARTDRFTFKNHGIIKTAQARNFYAFTIPNPTGQSLLAAGSLVVINNDILHLEPGDLFVAIQHATDTIDDMVEERSEKLHCTEKYLLGYKKKPSFSPDARYRLSLWRFIEDGPAGHEFMRAMRLDAQFGCEKFLIRSQFRRARVAAIAMPRAYVRSPRSLIRKRT